MEHLGKGTQERNHLHLISRLSWAGRREKKVLKPGGEGGMGYVGRCV